MQTVLDQVANRNHLHLIKAMVPYLPASRQRPVSVLLKVLELQNVLRFYRGGQPGTNACGATGASSGDPLEILSDLRNYCDEQEQGMIDPLIQMLGMAELYSALAQSEGGISPEMMMNLFQEGMKKNE